jgi:hypothetical protein
MSVALVGMMALLGCAREEPPEEARPDPLEEFADRDLRALDDGDATCLRELLAAALPDRYGPTRRRPANPWHLWRHQGADGDTRLLLFESYPIHDIPGTSSAAIHFLTPGGRLVGTSEFSTGWRIDLEAAEYRRDPILGPVIELRTGPVINGRNIRRQVYGVFDDRVGLLRPPGSVERGPPRVGAWCCASASAAGRRPADPAHRGLG